MNLQKLMDTAASMTASGKGLLAIDESTSTCNKRFAADGIPQTEEYRRAYRELIVTAPNLGASISGAILFDETIRQSTKAGKPFVGILKEAGIVPGIKVDEGAVDIPAFPGEKVTEGLDKLRGRLQEYGKMGARFSKWRAVITIGDGIPTQACIDANAHALARYAALCQEADIVPIVEPEVLMDGSHTIDQCFDASQRTHRALFAALFEQRVDMRGIILKPNMVLPAVDGPQVSDDVIAEATINCLLSTVPGAVPGVAFLSGGQSGPEACNRLSTMNARYRGKLPWALTFSFARATHQPAMDVWLGKDENVEAAQTSLIHRAHSASLARLGEYDKSRDD